MKQMALNQYSMEAAVGRLYLQTVVLGEHVKELEIEIAKLRGEPEEKPNE